MFYALQLLLRGANSKTPYPCRADVVSQEWCERNPIGWCQCQPDGTQPSLDRGHSIGDLFAWQGEEVANATPAQDSTWTVRTQISPLEASVIT